MEQLKGELTFNNDLVVGPQISGDTSKLLLWVHSWMVQLTLEIGFGAKMAGCDTDDDDRTGDICPDGFGNV